eukprot:945910-Amphidinium_carterae.1
MTSSLHCKVTPLASPSAARVGRIRVTPCRCYSWLAVLLDGCSSSGLISTAASRRTRFPTFTPHTM